MNTLADIFGAHDDHWMNHPNRPCAWGNPDDWFHPAADSDSKPPIRREPGWAKALCAGCEVATQCLAYALENEERWGVWAGTTGRERARLRRKAAA